jgi:hypothetical protein
MCITKQYQTNIDYFHHEQSTCIIDDPCITCLILFVYSRSINDLCRSKS